MNVGLDISAVVFGRGVSNYTSNLVQALNTYADVNLELLGYSWGEYQAMQRWFTRSNLSPRAKATILKRSPKFQELLWKLNLAKISDTLPNLDVFHSWDWLQPPDSNMPLVSTIHDLAIKHSPDTAHPDILAHHEQSWKILKQRNAHIIAVSRSTKQDICTLLNINPNLVHVVYEALPKETEELAKNLSEDKYSTIKSQLQLTKPFILFVGTREPRKNLARLVEAWQPLATEVDLIIAGAAGWDETTNHRLKYQPRFLGKVSNEALVVLYSEAELLAYPSLNEGFGLPILEAFYFGTPVVTTNGSAMKEVAGNAAELVNPLEVESITDGMKLILNESSDQQKKRLQRMIIRRQLFSWKDVAMKTKAVYQTAIESF